MIDEAPYELPCDALKKLSFDMSKTVSKCFGGASDMCEELKGVSTK